MRAEGLERQQKGEVTNRKAQQQSCLFDKTWAMTVLYAVSGKHWKRWLGASL